MTSEEVEKYINQVAFSGAEEFLEKYKNTESEKVFEFFRKQLNSNESLYFFETFPEFDLKLMNFLNSVAIYSNLRSDKESRSLQHLLDGEIIGFSRLENSLASNDLSEIKYTIANMTHFGKNRAKRIRLYWNILQNKSLQNIETIRLYKTFETNSLTTLEKEELKNEVIKILKQKNYVSSPNFMTWVTLTRKCTNIEYSKTPRFDEMGDSPSPLFCLVND